MNKTTLTKQEKIANKKQKFEDFLVNHFGRVFKTGDVIEVGESDKPEQFSVNWIEYVGGTFQLHCYAIRNGQIMDTLQKAFSNRCNHHNLFTKDQIKHFKFKLVS